MEEGWEFRFRSVFCSDSIGYLLFYTKRRSTSGHVLWFARIGREGLFVWAVDQCTLNGITFFNWLDLLMRNLVRLWVVLRERSMHLFYL